MERKQETVHPADLNALTDRLIQLAVVHEKAKTRDLSENAAAVRKDPAENDQ
jgi:hypothetical protein